MATERIDPAGGYSVNMTVIIYSQSQYICSPNRRDDEPNSTPHCPAHIIAFNPVVMMAECKGKLDPQGFYDTTTAAQLPAAILLSIA